MRCVGGGTTQLKELPSPEMVQARMAEIQAAIDASGYEPSCILSNDETAMTFGLPPKNQYVPKSAERAATPEGDEKARFASFISGSAKGLCPSFNIIKCSSKDPYNLSCSGVVHNLHRASFTKEAGWELSMWEKMLMLPSPKRGEAVSVGTLCSTLPNSHSRQACDHKPDQGMDGFRRHGDDV